jgi:excisionase family DNA binding protein
MDQSAATTPTQQLYRVPDAMRLLSLSRSVIYEQIRTGRLKSVTQGRTRLIPASAIAEYISLLQREADGGDAA